MVICCLIRFSAKIKKLLMQSLTKWHCRQPCECTCLILGELELLARFYILFSVAVYEIYEGSGRWSNRF